MKKLAILSLAVVLAISFSGLALAGEAKKEEQKAAPAPEKKAEEKKAAPAMPATPAAPAEKK